MSFRNGFAQRIEDIRLGSYTPKEEFDCKILPLLEFISNNLPSSFSNSEDVQSTV